MTKTKIIASLFICFLTIVGITSCSNNENNMDHNIEVVPGIYKASILLNADADKDLNNKSRGIDTLNGSFSSRYPFKEIYLHSGDNSTSNHKMLRIPIDKVESCEDCVGINLILEIKDQGGYIIKTRTGESIELSDKESVYFSSWNKPIWEAQISTKDLPFNKLGHEIYLEDKSINIELLRSYIYKPGHIYNYTKQDLLFLFTNPYGKTIQFSRHCNGFRMFVMFSEVNIEGGKEYKLDKKVFDDYLNSLEITNLSTNIYLGPYFCPRYDMYNMTSLTKSNKTGGYYSSDNQNYRDFEEVLYSHTGGGSAVNVQGFGFQTKNGKFLLAPILPTNNDSEKNQISITCFIRATYKDGTTALKYFTAKVPHIKFEPQQTHMNFIIMAFDYRDLKVFDRKNPTRSSLNDPEEIKLKPIMVMCE